MKKVIIGFAAVLISAFVVILAVNAQTDQKETKKCGTEVSKDGSKCQAASTCCKMKYGSTAEAKADDQAKCKEKCGDQAKCEGKCNHGACKNASASASGESKKCCESAPKAGSTN
jgi:hypothetical protein